MPLQCPGTCVYRSMSIIGYWKVIYGRRQVITITIHLLRIPDRQSTKNTITVPVRRCGHAVINSVYTHDIVWTLLIDASRIWQVS
jgi:hypothetical protein